MRACPRARRAAPTRSTGSPWATTSCWPPNYAWNATGTLPFAIFVNTIAPPAPVTKAPGPRDVQLQAGPRQDVPHPGAVHAAEGLHGGGAVHAARPSCARAPAAGSTPSRRSRATPSSCSARAARSPCPKGKKGKIRFYITVSKAQLLKAPFSTEGGSRVAETRLRVWYTAEGLEGGAVGARRPHQGLDRAHQVRRAARAQRHPL